jgi:hypothetical protein
MPGGERCLYISNDNIEWLRLQKQKTGFSESHLVNRSLDVMKERERYLFYSMLLTPLFFFVMACVLFVFAYFFSALLPTPVLYTQMFGAISMQVVACLGIYKVMRCKP